MGAIPCLRPVVLGPLRPAPTPFRRERAGGRGSPPRDGYELLDDLEAMFSKRVSRARDPTRRLSDGLAARRALSDGSWIVIAACKERRMLDVTLRHHRANLNSAAAGPRADISYVPE